MYGSQVGSLELIVNNISIWNLTGQQENNWLLAEVKLPSGNYTVFFNRFSKHLKRPNYFFLSNTTRF
jgi:hypothetical protein